MAHRTSAFAHVCDRSIGLGASQRFRDELHAEASRTLAAVSTNFIYRPGMKAWTMEIDPVDDRYLLVGTSTSNILLYDLYSLDFDEHSNAAGYDTTNQLGPVCCVRASAIGRASGSTATTNASLQFGISAVDWYPVDGGMFVSSALDGRVRIWDSDVFTVVNEFALPSKVHCAKFSRVATTHTFVAAATAQGDVRLCDLATSAAVHSLLGHTDEVWTLAWSLTNEFELSTGSRNGEIRMWDIRRSGATACLLCLNHEGEASVPGRARVHTNIKRLPSMTLAAASKPASRKRQRLDAAATRASSSSSTSRSSCAAAVRDSALPLVPLSSHTGKRNDPHAAASMSVAAAHLAGVNSLAYTPDGRYLLSSGNDQKLRLWHSSTGEHAFVNYEGVVNRVAARSLQMAVVQEAGADTSTLVFHPNGRDGELRAFDVFGDRGTPVLSATAHYQQITACVYRHSMRELFTGGEDGIIMKWRPGPIDLEPKRPEDSTESSDTRSHSTAAVATAPGDVDAWSDDDDDASDDGVDAERGDVFVPPILQQYADRVRDFSRQS